MKPVQEDLAARSVTSQWVVCSERLAHSGFPALSACSRLCVSASAHVCMRASVCMWARVCGVVCGYEGATRFSYRFDRRSALKPTFFGPAPPSEAQIAIFDSTSKGFLFFCFYFFFSTTVSKNVKNRGWDTWVTSLMNIRWLGGAGSARREALPTGEEATRSPHAAQPRPDALRVGTQSSGPSEPVLERRRKDLRGATNTRVLFPDLCPALSILKPRLQVLPRPVREAQLSSLKCQANAMTVPGPVRWGADSHVLSKDSQLGVQPSSDLSKGKLVTRTHLPTHAPEV